MPSNPTVLILPAVEKEFRVPSAAAGTLSVRIFEGEASSDTARLLIGDCSVETEALGNADSVTDEWHVLQKKRKPCGRVRLQVSSKLLDPAASLYAKLLRPSPSLRDAPAAAQAAAAAATASPIASPYGSPLGIAASAAAGADKIMSTLPSLQVQTAAHNGNAGMPPQSSQSPAAVSFAPSSVQERTELLVALPALLKEAEYVKYWTLAILQPVFNAAYSIHDLMRWRSRVKSFVAIVVWTAVVTHHLVSALALLCITGYYFSCLFERLRNVEAPFKRAEDYGSRDEMVRLVRRARTAAAREQAAAESAADAMAASKPGAVAAASSLLSPTALHHSSTTDLISDLRKGLAAARHVAAAMENIRAVENDARRLQYVVGIGALAFAFGLVISLANAASSVFRIVLLLGGYYALVKRLQCILGSSFLRLTTSFHSLDTLSTLCNVPGHSRAI
jgi:hypothetical protein